MVDSAEWVRTRAQRVKDPSRRTPDRETAHNNADNIERQLREDGHKIWGWVIYRCTYENDREWDQFMARLRFYIRDTLEFDNGVDMLESSDYHVFEDRTSFDNAQPSTIRDHFEHWTATAPSQEQGIEARQVERSQRYNFCLHVDQAALQSVISGPAPPEDELGDGFVNLVNLHTWGGMRPEHTEGRDERDHCWMRISYQYSMVTWYNLMRTQGMWRTEYRVPPEIGRP